jgi:GH25 family lysozyme M1 (1,4-beta-N-acetylmuramidase)
MKGKIVTILAIFWFSVLASAIVIQPPKVSAYESIVGIDFGYDTTVTDWKNLKKLDGVNFVIVKATGSLEDGTPTSNPNLENIISNGRGAMLSMGVYHFARPDKHTAGVEAQFFYNRTWNLNYDLPPALDIEPPSCEGQWDYLSDWCLCWLLTVGSLTDKQPMIYTTVDYAEHLYKSLTNYPLWIADLSTMPPNGSPRTGNWSSWMFWQFMQNKAINYVNGPIDWDCKKIGGVGGVTIPIDKFGLLAPYIGLTSTIILLTVATAIYIKRVKHRKEE